MRQFEMHPIGTPSKSAWQLAHKLKRQFVPSPTLAGKKTANDIT
jgi:hypothetical protein